MWAVIGETLVNLNNVQIFLIQEDQENNGKYIIQALLNTGIVLDLRTFDSKDECSVYCSNLKTSLGVTTSNGGEFF